MFNSLLIIYCHAISSGLLSNYDRNPISKPVRQFQSYFQVILYLLGSKRAGALMSHNSFCSSPSHESFTEASYETDTKSSGHWYFETVEKNNN